MSDDLERRLRARLRDAPLPPAPDGLHENVAGLASEVRPVTNMPRLGGLAALLAVLGLPVLVVLGSGLASPSPSPTPSASPSASLASPPMPSPSADELGSLHVWSVGELLAARASGELGGGRVALRGFWTDRTMMHSCAPPPGQPGDLELYCHGSEYGITERDEPIVTWLPGGHGEGASGPYLNPYVPEDLQRTLFTLPYTFGQPYPPVPIVVVGHFDDPRAADCRSEARQACRDRFVIERLVSFDVDAVVKPTPTPTPTPFPYADPPPAKYGAEWCAGDVPYSFVGWTTLGDLGIDIGSPLDHVYVMITRM